MSGNNKFSLAGAGVHPQSQQTSCEHKKNVSWSPELTSTSPTVDEALQILQLVQTLRQEISFIQTPTLQAVKWMFNGDIDSHNANGINLKDLIELITILLCIQLNRFPTVKEIINIIENDEKLDEDYLIKSITTLCQSDYGISSFRSVLAAFQIKDPVILNNAPQINSETLENPPPPLENLTENGESLPSSQVDLGHPQQQLSAEEQQKCLNLQLLRKEHNHLKNILTCLVCKERQVDATLLPCGHLVLCSICSNHCLSCPVCKKPALAEISTYLS
jgi:hypothetical protein